MLTPQAEDEPQGRVAEMRHCPLALTTQSTLHPKDGFRQSRIQGLPVPLDLIFRLRSVGFEKEFKRRFLYSFSFHGFQIQET